MSDCIFCKIVRGEIASEKVYEDEAIVGFLDITPVNPGHTLVVPKAHYTTLHDTPPEILQKMMVAGQKIAGGLKKMGAEGVNFGMNIEKAAGQVVFHTHLHIMPRREGDGYRLWHGKAYAEGAMQKTGVALRSALS